jgi:hypothetical protein
MLHAPNCLPQMQATGPWPELCDIKSFKLHVEAQSASAPYGSFCHLLMIFGGGCMPIKKGDFVTILPAFQDQGDDEFTWQAITDEEKGRVTLQALGTGMQLTPTYVMQADWIELAPAPTSLTRPPW